MLNLMLVDDDAVDVLSLKRALSKAGVRCRLTEASDGVTALAALRGDEMPPKGRVVSLDLNMPKMNGLEFMRTVRADPSIASTAIIVLTTSALEADRTEAHRLHCAGYFVKPLDFNVFVDLLSTFDEYWNKVVFWGK